jgi:hypothetical protein
MYTMTDKPHSPRDDFAQTVLGNCTTRVPFSFDFQPGDNGHTVVFAPTRMGMSMDYSALRLTDAEVAKVKAK